MIIALYIALGFLIGALVACAISLYKFSQYQKHRDFVEAHQRICLQQDFKDAVLEAALRGAAGPIVSNREEYHEM